MTKEKFLHKIVDKDVIKKNMITVAGQTFYEYEKHSEKSCQIFKGFEDYIVNNTHKNDTLDKISRDNTDETCSEKDMIN